MGQDRSPISQAVSGMAALGALLLLVSLFFDWFSASDGDNEISISGWNGLEFGDFLFLLIFGAVLAVILGSMRAPATTPADAPDRRTAAFLGLGGLALLFVILAAITTVPTVELLDSGSGTDVDISREAGLFVAAAGAILLLLAGGMGVASQAERRAAAERAPTQPAAQPPTPPATEQQPPPPPPTA
jgi:hypothetical protein